MDEGPTKKIHYAFFETRATNSSNLESKTFRMGDSFGLGTRTAIITGLAWWFIVRLGDATWCSFGLFPARAVIPLMIGTLPALVVAALAGTKFYKE